ncbi:MAG: aspartate aminotransferase family protein [Pseudomonadota bacterium]
MPALAAASHVMPTYRPFDVAFVRGEGAYVWDEAGRRYLDFNAGIAASALGHAHPAMVAALSEQAQKIWHTSNIFRIPGQVELADRLTAATFADLVFFTNSGAEAIECAIKTARKYFSARGEGNRQRVITFDGAFHGRTLGALAAGGNAAYLDGFGEPLSGFDQVAFGDHEALEAAIGPHTAAILVEPIQGEGGVRALPPQCLTGLRRLCSERGLLLIYDEVQCGMGRTGALFAHQRAEGAAPDIMAVAKGIGSGFPLGASLATSDAASGMVVGTHGSTLGGNPLAMAVGGAVLDVMLADGFLSSVVALGDALGARLERVVADYPDQLAEVRGAGLLRAVQCKHDNRVLLNACIDRGLLAAGGGDNVLRLVPPLIIDESHLAEAETLLRAALDDVAAGEGAG